MAKRERAKLKRQELNLFDGDFERLQDLLAPKKIAPGRFIRELVRRQIRIIEDKISLTHKPAEPLNDDLDGLATLPSSPEQP